MKSKESSKNKKWNVNNSSQKSILKKIPGKTEKIATETPSDSEKEEKFQKPAIQECRGTEAIQKVQINKIKDIWFTANSTFSEYFCPSKKNYLGFFGVCKKN